MLEITNLEKRDLIMSDNSVKAAIEAAIKNNVVAIDNGYAKQKIAYWAKEGDEFVIKTAAYPSRVEIGTSLMDVHGNSAFGAYTIDGLEYMVNPHSSDPLPNTGQSYSYSDQNSILITHSLMTQGFAGKEITLCTGLPYSDYFFGNELNTALFKKIQDKLATTKVESMTGQDSPVINEHHIKPESTSAFVDFAYDYETGDFKEPQLGMVVVDMGGYTTDVTFITPNVTIDKDKSDSKKIGVGTILKELETLIRRELNITGDISKLLIEKALTTGEIPFFNEQRDISELVKKAKRMTAKKLSAYIESIVGDGGMVDSIIFVGGGSHVLGEELKEERSNVVIPDESSYANARGMLLYMTFFNNATH